MCFAQSWTSSKHCPLWLVEVILSRLPLRLSWWNCLILPRALSGFFVPLRTALGLTPTPTGPLTSSLSRSIHSSYLPYRVNRRGCCLRSRCCHKVLISVDIWSPERPFNTALAISPHQSCIRFRVSPRDPRLIICEMANWFDRGLAAPHLGIEVTLG